MEGSSPPNEEEEKPGNGDPSTDLFDIKVWGDLEIEENFSPNTVDSCSIGNVGTEGGTKGGTEGAGMDIVGLNGKGKSQDEVFRTEEELRQWISSTGKLHGFVIIVMGSEKAPKNRRPRMRFSCERSGKYRPYVNKAKAKGGKVNEANGKGEGVKEGVKMPRITGSKKCECPFELRCVKGSEGWTVTVVNGTHNHDPAKQLEGHAYAGRLSLEERELLVDMSASSLSKPREILSLMKAKDASNVTTIKSVYNARFKHQFVERAGRTQMQFLLSKLQENEYVYFHQKDDNDCVTSLFWSNPTSVDLMRAFPTILLMDCTYKTNRYRFPLMQMVGVTSTDKTFSVAQAFINREKEENYVWVLENLKRVMDTDRLPSVIVTDRECNREGVPKCKASFVPMAH